MMMHQDAAWSPNPPKHLGAQRHAIRLGSLFHSINP